MPITRAILASVFSLLLTSVTHAQQCKIKFVIAHWDGKTLQVGLTPEQLKFWNHEKVKRYSIMCLSGNEPDYVIAWSENSSMGDLSKLGIQRQSGESDPEAAITISADRYGTAARYAIYYVSKTTSEVIHTGFGSKDAPAGPQSSTERGIAANGPSIDPSRMTSSVADPTEAIKNALDWLKKRK